MPVEGRRKLNDTIEEDSKGESLASSVAFVSKKSKSRRGLKFFIFFVLLITGIIVGMHTSGTVDIRPFVWNVVPKIPFIGDYLKEHLSIPEIYTLTVSERRKLELQQWQQRLDTRERELLENSAELESLQNDIESRQRRVERQENDLLDKERVIAKGKNEATPEEEALIKEIANTYREISPRRAARIIAQLPENLSIELMRNLPQDARASILARMDPRRAARITENLADPQ